MKKYDEYKDSGVAWIGDVPKHWEVKKMNYHCSTITDFVASGSFADLRKNVLYLDEPDYAMLIRTADLSSNDRKLPPVYISKCSYEFLSNSNLFGGEVVLPNIGASIGNVYMVPKLYKHMSLAPNAIMVKSYGNDRFLYYYFKSKPGVDSLMLIGMAAAQDKFNKTELRSLKVLVPPLGEQVAIATYLDTHCAKIDNLISIQQKRIALLQELKQSVITHAVTKGLNPNVEMKQSGVEWIGDVPKHWEVTKLKFKYHFQTGATPNTGKKENFEGELKWANISDLNGSVVYDTTKHINKKAASKCSMNISPKGSLMYSFKLSVGSVAFCGEDMYTNEAIASFIPQKNDLKYLFYCAPIFIIHNANRNIYNAPLLNQELIKNALICLPSLTEQAAIASYLDRKCATIDTSISNAQHQIELLQEYKQSLITEVVTGKRKVTDN